MCPPAETAALLPQARVYRSDDIGFAGQQPVRSPGSLFGSSTATTINSGAAETVRYSEPGLKLMPPTAVVSGRPNVGDIRQTPLGWVNGIASSGAFHRRSAGRRHRAAMVRMVGPAEITLSVIRNDMANAHLGRLVCLPSLWSLRSALVVFRGTAIRDFGILRELALAPCASFYQEHAGRRLRLRTIFSAAADGRRPTAKLRQNYSASAANHLDLALQTRWTRNFPGN